MNTLIEYNENLAIDTDKPALYSGLDLDFNRLTDRNFEILLYRIFKEKIDNGKFSGEFDKIMLMTGVRDKGQDCALFYDQQQIGLI